MLIKTSPIPFAPSALCAAAALALIGAGGLVSPVAAAPVQATPSVSSTAVFAGTLPRIKRKTQLAVLLPSRVPAFVTPDRLSPSGSARAGAYALALASSPDCGGATACFVGSFSAHRGQRPSFRRRLRLTGGRIGYYKPLTCGASCSPPVIQWMRGSALYEISYAGASRKHDRSLLVGLANSAIRSGPR
jgi:hypothetical protein